MASRVPGSAMASRVPGSAMASRAPCSAVASRVPGSAVAFRAPCSAVASRAPCSAVGPGTGAALEASCPVSVSLEASRAPPPPPPLDGTPFWRGEYCQTCVPHVTCFPSSHAHIWFVPVPVLICYYQFPALCL